MPRDDAENAHIDRLVTWEDDPTAPSALECLSAAGLTREGSAHALPAPLALSVASNMDLGRATRVATEMMILMRKIEAANLCHHSITFVP